MTFRHPRSMETLVAAIPVVGLLVAVTKDPRLWGDHVQLEHTWCWEGPAPGRGLLMPTAGREGIQRI